MDKHSPYWKNYAARLSGVKYNKEKKISDKKAHQIQQHNRISMRQIASMERDVIKIIGNNPYPYTASRDQILCGGHPAGFCYKSNGELKTPISKGGSHARSVVVNMDGKEGLISTPAEYVVGDSPMINEILSQPELTHLLCELRNTSILMIDSEEFKKFSEKLKNHSTDLPFKENAADYLRNYRFNLIKQFLITLKDSIDKALSEEPKSILVVKERSEQIESMKKLTISEWNSLHQETQVATTDVEMQTDAETDARERAIALEDELKQGDEDKTEISDKAMQSKRLMAFSGIPTLYTNREIGFEKYRHPPSNEIPQIPVALVVEHPKEKLLQNKSQLEAKKSRDISIRNRRKQNFVDYVRGLISEAKNIFEMGKNVKGLQRKKPTGNDRIVSNPLVSLLKKESLFKSLNADDFLFLEYEGGKKALEKRIAKKFNLSNKPRPGGFTYIVPTPAELEEETDAALEQKMNETWDKVMGGGASNGSRPSSVRSNSNQFSCMSVETSLNKNTKSMNRVCCLACKAKVRQQCERIQSRIHKFQHSINEPAWNYRSKHPYAQLHIKRDPTINTNHFLRSVPYTTHKNYSHQFTKNPVSKKVFVPESKNKPTPAVAVSEVPVVSILPGGRSKRKPFNTSVSPSVYPTLKQNEKESSALKLKKTTVTPKSKIAFANPDPHHHHASGIPSLIKYSDVEKNRSLKSWSLFVSKMDIIKLKNELDHHIVLDKKATFEKKFLKT